MDDRFLKDARRPPRGDFTRTLKERLDNETTVPAARRPRHTLRWAGPLLGLAAATILIITVPALRASAAAFLDLFRVRTFAALPVDPARMQQLTGGTFDINHLLADQIRTIREPGEPRSVPTPDAAAAVAGFHVRTPAWLPNGVTLDSVSVTGEGEAEVTVNVARLKDLMDAMNVDIPLPDGLDGTRVDVRMPTSVRIVYKGEKTRGTLLQAPSPEVSLPAGLDLPKLAEIGLRIAGLDPSEARRMAQSVDWRSTLLVPIPTDAGTFHEVSVQGARGLMVESTRANRRGSVLLWSDGSMVYALCGTMDQIDLTQMAQSLQ